MLANGAVTSLPEQEVEQQVVMQAAEWHALVQSGQMSESEREALSVWCDADPAHKLAFERMGVLWQRFDNAGDPALAHSTMRRVLVKRSSRLQRNTLKLIPLAVAIGAVCIISASPVTDYLLADYRTGIGEQRVVELEDHSRIVLNTNSSIEVNYSERGRHIRLRRGEVMVDVAADRTRPFVIETEFGTARALGTRYVVRRDEGSVDVSVIESVVHACANQSTVCVDLHEGDSVRMSAGDVGTVVKRDMQSETAWLRSNLIVDDLPLADVLLELKRYRTGHIAFDATQIADIRVSGVFPLDDTDRALSMLAATAPIEVRHYTPLWASIRPREK